MKSLLHVTNQPKARHNYLSNLGGNNKHNSFCNCFVRKAVDEVLFIIHDQQWRKKLRHFFGVFRGPFGGRHGVCVGLRRELFSTNAAIYRLEAQFSWKSKFSFKVTSGIMEVYPLIHLTAF